jgi:hypothetical protein
MNRAKEVYRQIDLISDLDDGKKRYMMVHGANLTKDSIEYASSKGIDVIFGADNGDSQSLVRVRQIFESFDVIVTDYIGSHVLYAILSGAHVRFADFSSFGIRESRLPDREHYRNSPHAASDFYKYEVLFSEPKILNHLLQEAGICDPDSALREAGGTEKLSPEELKGIFGWNKSIRFPKAARLGSSIRGNLWILKRLFTRLSRLYRKRRTAPIRQR